MNSDFGVLLDLNIKIGDWETAGNGPALDGVIASKLAFRRASGAIDERGTLGGSQADGYLDKVQTSPVRETEIESIHVYKNRAVVTCVVTMPLSPPDQRKRYHNIRLFIREGDVWKLLGWANEEIP